MMKSKNSLGEKAKETANTISRKTPRRSSKKEARKILACILCVMTALAFMPALTFAASEGAANAKMNETVSGLSETKASNAAAGEKTTLYIDKGYGNTEIGDETVHGFDQNGNEINTANPNGYIIKQTNSASTTSNSITVTSGTHDIVLDVVNIESSYESSFGIEGNATVNLTLNTGSTNTIKSANDAGIQVEETATLNISGNGKLIAIGGENGAGIGGGSQESGGKIEISGGTIEATGGENGAGIGGGSRGSGGDIEISEGTITAKGGDYGAGIGGGLYESGGDIKISGGTIEADGGECGAGIGGGNQGVGGDIKVSGGTITAKGGYSGAGIGGGYSGSGGNIEISGGTIEATGGENGSGIGGGCYESGGNVTIGGGSIKAVAGTGADNIGGGIGKTGTGTLKAPGSDSANVYLTTVTLDGISEATLITSLKTNTPYTYGTKDMKTDATGKLYLYLPQSTKTTEVITNAKKFHGLIITDANNPEPGRLLPITIPAPAYVKANLAGKYNTIKASWGAVKVSGYTVGYKVEYKKGSGKYALLTAGTATTSKTKKALAAGKKYTFKVTPYITAYNTKYYGPSKTSSAIYTLKKISKPKLKKASKKTIIKISWKNIQGETGYQISQVTKKSKTKIVSTYKTTKGKYKKIKAKKGKKYFYKIRAYKTVSGKKIYAPWSKVVAYKIK